MPFQEAAYNITIFIPWYAAGTQNLLLIMTVNSNASEVLSDSMQAHSAISMISSVDRFSISCEITTAAQIDSDIEFNVGFYKYSMVY